MQQKTKLTTSAIPIYSIPGAVPLNRQSNVCAHCGSIQTVCLFHEHRGSISNFSLTEEYFCFECSQYTQYSGERVS